MKTINRKELGNILLFRIGWFWLPIQYNRRSIDKSSPPVITFVLAFMCNPKEATNPNGEKEKALRNLILSPFHSAINPITVDDKTKTSRDVIML